MYLGEKMSVRLHFSSLAGNNKAEFRALHFLTDCSQQDRDALRGHTTPVSWLAHGHHRRILILWTLDVESETF